MSRSANKRFYRLDSHQDFSNGEGVKNCINRHENQWNFEVAWEAANKGEIIVQSKIENVY